MEYSTERRQSDKKVLNSKKEGWGWLSLSYQVCGWGLGLCLRAVATSRSSSCLRRCFASILDGTVDQDALPIDQMMSH